jgi:hypothetical protein
MCEMSSNRHITEVLNNNNITFTRIFKDYYRYANCYKHKISLTDNLMDRDELQKVLEVVSQQLIERGLPVLSAVINKHYGEPLNNYTHNYFNRRAITITISDGKQKAGQDSPDVL